MPPGFNEFLGSAPPVDVSLVEMAIYGAALLLLVIFLLVMLGVATLPLFFLAMFGMEAGLRGVQNLPDPIGKLSKLAGLVFRGLRRSLLRTALTYAALFVLTGMLTAIYSVVDFLGKIIQEKEENVQVILTERFSIPSVMPPGYAERLRTIIQTKLPPESRPNDLDANLMTWSFVGGTLDPNSRTLENSLVLLAQKPDTILTMMDIHGLSRDDLSAEEYADLGRAVEKLKEDKRNIIVGQDRLNVIGKKVGDDIKMYSLNYTNLEFEFKIVGRYPAGNRQGMAATMRTDYLFSKLDEYRAKKGADHPKSRTCINLVWVRLPNRQAYEQLAGIVNEPGAFSAPAVKLETASAGISSFLDAYKDIFWGMKFVLMPTIMAIMCLVVGITITIGVRERWTEMAVLKVLGFQPWQVMAMITGEAILIGVFGGLLSTWALYFSPHLLTWLKTTFGVQFQIAFFNNFAPPATVVLYGPVLGVLVGLIGSAVPSWSVRRVKVSEVFAKVA